MARTGTPLQTNCGKLGKKVRRSRPGRQFVFAERMQIRPKPGPLITLLTPLCIAMQACGSDPVGCDPCFTTAVIYGAVVDSAGRPAAGVPVDVLAHVGGCDSPFRGFMHTTANSGGGYRALAGSLHSPFTADCFAITANVDGDARWPRGRAVIAGRVEFRAELDGLPRDSIRLDLVVGTQ